MTVATIADIGVPGQPLSTPALTAWQAAVRDLLNKHAAADVWTAYTPTITGGTASATDCRYQRTPGGRVTLNGTVTLSTVTGSLLIGLPVAATKEAHGICYIQDADGQAYLGLARIPAGGSTATVYVLGAAGSYATIALISATVPHTWAAGDKASINLIYQCAPLP